jgi:lysophospholipid acyltransferase (LPLAT)-like uncharacterized protein
MLGATIRLRLHDPHQVVRRLGPDPVIFAFWHNRILLMPYIYRKVSPGRRLKVMISRSRDGEFISAVAARFGIGAVRGSSSRGAVSALREAVRVLQEGASDIGITPDGPRGPRHVVQEGVVRMARQSGAAVVPVTYALSWKWEANSWDRFQVPLPFSRCDLHFGPMLSPATMEDDALRAAITQALSVDREASCHGTSA